VAESQAIEPMGGAAGRTESDAPEFAAADPDVALYCYRHPDRETRLRCRTCDRPICAKCAIQTPVGFRCPEDGRVKNDPLSTLKPQQLVLAIGIAVGGGLIAGYIANSIGFFSIIIAFFAGGIVVEAEDRIVGLKRGPVMTAVVVGGILVGGVAGFAYGWASFYGQIAAAGGSDEAQAAIGPLLQQQITYALLTAGAACVGAWQRLR
jgi:hypothetical protein